MFGLDDPQALLSSSSANPDYLVLPKCGSAALIGLVGTLLREAGKTAQIIALIESAKGVGALDEIASADHKPAALLFGAADMAADLGAETAWEPLTLGEVTHCSGERIRRNRSFGFTVFRYCRYRRPQTGNQSIRRVWDFTANVQIHSGTNPNHQCGPNPRRTTSRRSAPDTHRKPWGRRFYRPPDGG